MKKLLILSLFLLAASAVLAQSQTKAEAPEARPFENGVTSFEQYEAERKKTKPAPAKTPDKRQPNVEIWLPPEFQSTEQKWPLLIFSHGFGGCAKQSAFLTEYLADQGYIVIAPDHQDARCRGHFNGGGGLSGGMRGGTKDWPEKPFRTPDVWTDKTDADRRDDVLFALASMLDDRMYKPYIDTERMGLIGHSLGGYTVLGLAGGWSSWKDERFKAVVALSPYIGPYVRKKTLRSIDVPVLYEGGTKDKPITPEIMRRGGGYDQTPAPKYFIELDGGDHFSFTELDRGYQDIIRRTVLAFVNKYVKGENVSIDEAKKPGIHTFWKDEGQGADKE